MTYTPPGVTVQELSTPTISPALGAATTACVVGLSNGVVRRTDAVTLTGTTASALPGLPAGASLVSGSPNVKVFDSYLVPSTVPVTYDSTNGYAAAEWVVNTTTNTLARATSGGSGASGASLIPDGETVYITYDYVPSDYFTAALYDDLATIEARYGAATDSVGTILSPLTFAAQMAFEGGAAQLWIAPLFILTTPSDPSTKRLQPNTTQAAASSTWQQTLYALRDVSDINVIIPAVGQSQANVTDAALLAIFHEVQDHCWVMSQDEDYVLGIYGEDSTTDSTKATKTTIRAHADDLRSRHGGLTAQMSVLMNTANFSRSAPTPSGVVNIGGQYLAASFAGLLASMPVSESATRSVLSGASKINDLRSKQDRLDDGAKGLLVLEQRDGVLIIRHAITLDQTSSANRQISVVRAKFRTIEAIRDTLETQVIGKTVVNANAGLFVATAVQNVLERLVSDGDIISYSTVQGRQLTGDPSTVEVRFDYRPAFALDYINVKFSLDLTAQTVTANA